jgi:uncharacterized membrane protein YfcA
VPAVEALALVAAGVVAGVFSTVVGLASVVSYPALLAIGLPPLSANMTNTVSLLFTGAGAAVGSRPELTGQAARIRRLGIITAIGGGTGAALLLVTPPQTFERVAPVLIGAASLALLVRPRRGHESHRRDTGPGRREGEPGGRDTAPGRPDTEPTRPDGEPGRRRNHARNLWLPAGVFGTAIYIGYFGAAGGILMLALLAAMMAEPLARTNAVKNILGAVANAVAAAAFAVLGHVDWAAVVPLAAGFITGGWIGPALVRRIPGQVLRTLVAVCGLAVAVKLGISAYQ